MSIADRTTQTTWEGPPSLWRRHAIGRQQRSAGRPAGDLGLPN